jgi:RHS repeat-associated protein
MRTRRNVRSWLATLAATTMFLPVWIFAETGDDNPTGVAGEHNGNVTTADEHSTYDPLTGNWHREIVDIAVPGSVGKYPLKWTRYWNGHTNYSDVAVGAQWRFSYLNYVASSFFAFPDGRVVSSSSYGVEEGGSFAPYNPQCDCYPSATIHLADGGQVLFQPITGLGGVQPVAITDPYGQTTTISYTILYYDFYHNPVYYPTRITEPGGRYLQISYNSSTDLDANGKHITGTIKQVAAYDGVSSQPMQSVTYTWQSQNNLKLNNGVTAPLTSIDLLRVDYSDGTHASYAYGAGAYQNGCNCGGATPPPAYAPRINTASDPHYSGAMRQIALTYLGGNTNGLRIVSENHAVLSNGSLVAGEAISSWNSTTWVETRGDGAQRTFGYFNPVKLSPGCAIQCSEMDQQPSPPDGELATETDFLGHTIATLGYDGGGFISTVKDANGHITSYQRQANSWGITQITHPDGSTIQQTFYPAQGLDANSAPWYLASRTDENGHTTTYTRDNNLRITRKDYPDGSFETFTYNNFGEVVTHELTSGGTEYFSYDSRGLKTSYTDATGSGPGDPNHTTTYTYYTAADNGGGWTDRLKTVTHPKNASGFQAAETYEYDHSFDQNGNQTATPAAGRGLVTKITYADGNFITKTYDQYGDVLTSTDELGHTTSYTYDDYGRVLTTTDPLNNVTINSYLEPGQTSSYVTTSKTPFVTTLPSGKKTNFYYDANWRKSRVQVAPGTSDEADTYFYYDQGTRPADGSTNIGLLTSTKDPRGNSTTYAYDIRDRQIQITDALSHTTSFVFDFVGNKTSETHANGELITYDQYDPMNRLLQKTVHRDNNTPPTLDVTHNTYDSAGNLDTHTDEDGNVYDYDYDKMNRPTKTTYPNNLFEVHSYDAAGNVQTYTNRSGAVQTFSYDNRNRQTHFTWSDSTSPQTTAYDAASRKTEIDNNDATISLGYDNDNRLTTQTEKEVTTGIGDNVARTVTYTYDADGNRLTIQYPSGAKFDYAYTQRNQVANIKPDGGTNPIVSYIFDPSGNITSRSLDNGTSTAYTVDAVDKDTSIVATLTGSVTKRFDYAYNSVNDILAVQRDSGTGDGFTYDLTQQILGFAQNGTVNLSTGVVTNPATNTNMTFDGCGNQKSLNGGGSFVANNLNQYTTYNGYALGYDNNGNLTSYNGSMYTYDAQNRLRQATSGSVSAAFYYDGLNRQVARVISSVKTFSVWDGDWALLEEYSSTGARVQGYVQGYHGLVKTLVNNIYYYQDELGSTSHIASTSGALIESYQYAPYGKPLVFNAGGVYQPGATPQAQDLFTGQRWRSELGLYDNRNRFMSPDVGRFLQPDPIGFKGDASNLYRYCANDWANRTDPMGLDGYDPIHNFIGGLDDTITFGLGKQLVSIAFPGYSSTFDRDSIAYHAGQGLGIPAAMITGEGEVGAAKFEANAAKLARQSKINRTLADSERRAIWKKEAQENASRYKPSDVERMKQGKPPIGPDGHPVELHHNDGTHEGGVTQMNRTEHRLGDNYQKNHPWVQTKNRAVQPMPAPPPGAPPDEIEKHR